MTGSDEFHHEIISRGYKHPRAGIETTFYSAKSVEVIDPSGNRIPFNAEVEPDTRKH